MLKRRSKNERSNYSYLIGLLIGLFLLIIVALQNSQPVSLKLLFWEIDSSLPKMLTIFFALGFIIGVLTSLINLFKKDRVISRQAKEIQKLERDLDELNDKNDENPY